MAAQLTFRKLRWLRAESFESHRRHFFPVAALPKDQDGDIGAGDQRALRFDLPHTLARPHKDVFSFSGISSTAVQASSCQIPSGTAQNRVNIALPEWLQNHVGRAHLCGRHHFFQLG